MHLYSMEGPICNTPDKIWQVADICNVPKFCMQRYIFVIAISGFLSRTFYHFTPVLSHFTSRFCRGAANTLCRIGARSFRSYTLDFLTSQRLALYSTFLHIMSNASGFIIISLHLRIALTAYLCLLNLLQTAARTPVSVFLIILLYANISE